MKKIQIYKGKEPFVWGRLIKEDTESFYIYMKDSYRIPIKLPKWAYSYQLLETK